MLEKRKKRKLRRFFCSIWNYCMNGRLIWLLYGNRFKKRHVKSILWQTTKHEDQTFEKWGRRVCLSVSKRMLTGGNPPSWKKRVRVTAKGLEETDSKQPNIRADWLVKWAREVCLGPGGPHQSLGGPLDSVYFPIYPKNFPSRRAKNPLKCLGGLGGDPSSLTPPPQEKKTLGGVIVNVKFSNSPQINLLKPVNISAWCGPCVCVGHERTTQFFRLRRAKSVEGVSPTFKFLYSLRLLLG